MNLHPYHRAFPISRFTIFQRSHSHRIEAPSLCSSHSQLQIKRAFDPAYVLAADVDVALGCFYVLVAEQLLDVANVDAALQQMRCEGMTQGMDAGVLFNACDKQGSLKDFLCGAFVKRL